MKKVLFIILMTVVLVYITNDPNMKVDTTIATITTPTYSDPVVELNMIIRFLSAPVIGFLVWLSSKSVQRQV